MVWLVCMSISNKPLSMRFDSRTDVENISCKQASDPMNIGYENGDKVKRRRMHIDTHIHIQCEIERERESEEMRIESILCWQNENQRSTTTMREEQKSDTNQFVCSIDWYFTFKYTKRRHSNSFLTGVFIELPLKKRRNELLTKKSWTKNEEEEKIQISTFL